MEKVYKLTPALKDNLWGGVKLKGYGKDETAPIIAESWELSFTKGGEARIEDGRTLTEAFPRDAWGSACDKFEFFPTLTKFIDARENLSVQVHPGDDYALEHEGQYGKSEMWYVVSADEGAGLYMGFRDEYTKDDIRAAIADGTVENMLSFKEVRAGDVFFIPAGTVHAIGGGVLIFEIQQNSTLTYRLYDYGRRDKHGNLRELHVDRAMKVLNTGVYLPQQLPPSESDGERLIGECEYFRVTEYTLADSSACFTVTEDSFKSVTVISGECVISAEGEEYTARAGDSFFIPASTDATRITLRGTARVITTEV